VAVPPLRPVASDPAAESDIELVRRIAQQDRQAFETLYHRIYPRLQGYLLRLVAREEMVGEILNDVMLVVWQKASSFEGRSQPSTWILGIAYNKAIKRLRQLSSQPLPIPPAVVDTFEDTSQTEEQSRRELILSLQSALESLSPEQRAVVELTCHYGYSYKEIAALTNVPVNTVKTRMFYARKRLKEAWPGPQADSEIEPLEEERP